MFDARTAALVLLLVTPSPEPEVLLRMADAARHAIDEGVVRVHVAVAEPGEPVLESVLDVYVRGDDHVLCVFREGLQQDRRILVAGDRAWLLLPRVARPIPIGASQRLLGGASVADVARLRFSDFAAEPAGEEVLDGTPCLVLDLAARTPSAPYASGRLWVGRDDLLPRRARLALRSGREAKEIRFVEYAREHGRPRLGRMEVRHLLARERGTVTTVRFVDYEARELPADLFEPDGARELR
jgi:hypothetical protein